MSSEDLPPDGIKEPRPFRLLLVACVLIAAAGFAVFVGIRGRAQATQEVEQRTAEAAIPAVDVFLPQRGAKAVDLVLPGDIQAFQTASIYPRASGYVSGWYKDIGARVTKGEKLADIDTPE